MAKNNALYGRLALLSTSVIWGTSFIVLKNALENIGTLWVLAIRFSIAALMMALLARGRLKTMSRRCIRGGILTGIALALAYIVQTYGLLYTTPGKNAFLTSIYCVMTPFLAWAVYRRRPGASNVIAAILCVAGIGLVSLSEGFTSVNIGDLLTLGCGIFYAAQIIILEQYGDSGDAATISAVEFLTAALLCWAGALVFETAPVQVPAATWLGILYLAVMCTGVCFFLEAWGMQYTSGSTAAMIMTLEAVFAVLFSILFYHEIVTARIAFGFALIFAAVVISEYKPTRKTA